MTGGRVRPRALEADDDDDQWRRQQRRRRAGDRDEDDEEVRGSARETNNIDRSNRTLFSPRPDRSLSSRPHDAIPRRRVSFVHLTR
jgi:hypothetical protein